MNATGSEEAAYAALRAAAMDARIGLEEAAARILAKPIRPVTKGGAR
jgi:AmiR/NasT family two-component response regulator